MKTIITIMLFITAASTSLAGSAKYGCRINNVIYHEDLTNTVTATCTLTDLFGNSDILDIREICAVSQKGEIRCGHGNETWRLEKGQYLKFTHTFGETETIIKRVYVKQ